jgi:hypothetical protein
MPLTYPPPVHNHINKINDYTGYIFVETWGTTLPVFVIYIYVSRRILSLAYTYINTIINGGEVCGRHADDARLIHASVTAGLRGGLLLQTPQLDDPPDQWATFLPGEQGFAPRY